MLATSRSSGPCRRCSKTPWAGRITRSHGISPSKSSTRSGAKEPDAATLIDLVHALAMAAWVLGLPLLVWRRHARLSRAYAIYALTFVIVSQVSHWVLGECFLTTLAAVSRLLWK